MSQSKWSVLIAASAGIAAGIASSVVMSAQRRPEPAQQAAATPPQAARELVPILLAPAPDPVQELGARQADPRQAAAPAPRPGPADEPQTVEQQKRATWDRHDALVRAHHQQLVDPAWSARTSAMLKADLGEIAQTSSFELVQTECRTTSCLATMQWPTYGKAQAEWRKLLHHGYQANCSREITLPEPSDETAPYQATLVLDCEGWRAETP